MFTVKQLSKLAGITPRTLHHYDRIGLLHPARVGENGYRYYDQSCLYRLQQILLYRELDLPLEQVKEILDKPDFNPLQALQLHKTALAERIKYLERLTASIGEMIESMKEDEPMSETRMFDVFNKKQQKEYEKEALKMYDPVVVKESNRKWGGYSAAEKQRIGEEGNAIYADIVAAMPLGADSAQVQACIRRWRTHMDYFWTPTPNQLMAIAEGYSSDPRFKENFDKLHPSLAAFMGEAVRIYVQNLH
jgi:DNA-binding transcriptional MerR regulator